METSDIDWKTRALAAEAERDLHYQNVLSISESSATTIDRLEAKLVAVEAEHEKDKQAWMAENTELLTQVERLTAQLEAKNVS